MRIKDPVWSGLKPDSRQSLAWESNDNKEKIIAQFVVDSRTSVPVTKNQNLHTTYRMEFNDSDGYGSNFTANFEGTYQLNANSTMFNTTADDDSNREIILEEVI